MGKFYYDKKGYPRPRRARFATSPDSYCTLKAENIGLLPF